MRNHWTQKECTTIINMYKNKTAYFGNNEIMGENVPMKFSDMYEMFRFRYGFGEAETNVILASLMKCGAKFID